MKKYIKGSFRRSIYKAESGYMVGLFKIRETNDDDIVDYVNETVTFTGFFHDLNHDDTYIFYGKMVDHDRYGIQYEVSEYERVKPEGKDGLIEFLSSDIFSGVGEKLAVKIVEYFGDDVIARIKSNPQELILVKGMTEKKANSIYETLLKYEESEDIIISLCDIGFSTKEALFIYKRYGLISLEMVRNNIYDLIDIGFFFNKIDAFRTKLEIANDDKRRINAITIYVMNELCFKNGDTYLFFDEIDEFVYKNFDIRISSEDLGSNKKIFVDKDKYYLQNYFDAEESISKMIRHYGEKENNKFKKLNSYIKDLEAINNITYNKEQKEAITCALNDNFLIITGGPGTGKTTIIKAIVELYQMIYDLDYDALASDLALIAPTGRAAKRMSDATMLPSFTIHRFLKWNKDTDSFSVNENNKSNAKFVIIDEVSMIDTLLLHNLIKGLKSDVKILLVGDYNQLPSVAPGQVLKDLIESEMVNVISLNVLYRQDSDSYIPQLASEIKDNNLSHDFYSNKDDFKFISTSNDNLKEAVIQVCKKAIEKGYSEKDIQVLCPMYKGENGIDALNVVLQKIFNKEDETKNEYKHGGIIYREKDKVLQLQNMPDENIFNGDIGFIRYIKKPEVSNSNKLEIHVDFDGNIVKYYIKDLINITHAYVVSIHKSQGSEFKIVVMPVINSYRRMLYKKLIYTGITRAKSSLIIVGDKDVFTYGIATLEEKNRKTTLKDMLTK